MSRQTRSYHYKTVDMLISSATIADTAIKEQDFLVQKRPTWAPPFFSNLRADIDRVIKLHLGKDGAKGLRESTAALLSVQSSAIKDLGNLKMEITEDFKKNKPRREEILKQLGFNLYLKDARNGDQEALINLLSQCNLNITPTLRTEITEAGTNSQLLDKIVGYADAFTEANISQEGFKGDRKSITAETTAAVNDIYDRVISICKISARYYSDQPDMKEKFSFKKVSSALNKTPKMDHNNDQKTS